MFPYFSVTSGKLSFMASNSSPFPLHQSTAKEVAMLLTTLDPDEPYTLKWDIKLEIQEWVALNGNSGNYVFDFLVNFNSYLLDVKISDQK